MEDIILSVFGDDANALPSNRLIFMVRKEATTISNYPQFVPPSSADEFRRILYQLGDLIESMEDGQQRLNFGRILMILAYIYFYRSEIGIENYRIYAKVICNKIELYVHYRAIYRKLIEVYEDKDVANLDNIV
jgi:hypothetical protein